MVKNNDCEVRITDIRRITEGLWENIALINFIIIIRIRCMDHMSKRYSAVDYASAADPGEHLAGARIPRTVLPWRRRSRYSRVSVFFHKGR